MGAYDSLLKDQLRDLCLQRSLNVSGTNAELIARLEGYDAAHAPEQEPDLLAAISEEQEQSVAAPVDPAEDAAPQPPEREDEPEPVGPNRTVHRVRYEYNESSLAQNHEVWLRATENAALGAGFAIRGSARRVSFEQDGGKSYAIYEVSLGRPRNAPR